MSSGGPDYSGHKVSSHTAWVTVEFSPILGSPLSSLLHAPPGPSPPGFKGVEIVRGLKETPHPKKRSPRGENAKMLRLLCVRHRRCG